MDLIIAIIVWIALGGFALLSLTTFVGMICAITLSSKISQEEEKEKCQKTHQKIIQI